jgi:hypothetical protein
MRKVSSEFNTSIKEIDADEIIQTEDFELNFHPDDRGFAFMTCKVYKDEVLPRLEKLFEPSS